MDIKNTLTTIIRDGFILVFNEDKLDIVKTAEALIEAGFGNMEVTCRIRKPLEKLQRLRRELPKFCAGAASLIDFEACSRSIIARTRTTPCRRFGRSSTPGQATSSLPPISAMRATRPLPAACP